jgi:hypothetical protein
LLPIATPDLHGYLQQDKGTEGRHQVYWALLYPRIWARGWELAPQLKLKAKRLLP